MKPARIWLIWAFLVALLIGVTLVITTEPANSAAATVAVSPATHPNHRVAGQISNTLRALDTLRSYGYTIYPEKRAIRAVRAWQKANGLTVDGIVGPETLNSLGLAATATVPAVRTLPPAGRVPSPGPVGGVEQIIRDIWPDELEDNAVAIAWRESRHQPEVINRNGDATGLFQIMWSVHRGWLCPQLGICAQSALQDAHTNATAALALYNRASGWGPWRL